jgi:uncharacterized protein YdeI (BOF family)
MKKTIIAAIVALFVAPAMAQGNPNTPRVDKREARQEARIEQGKASGELNAKEAARLEKGQDKVEAAEANAKSDGTVTKKERAKLTHMQNKQSRKIAREKHDKQKAN